MTIPELCRTMKQINQSKEYLNESTADVFFICGEDESVERIPAHKFVLFANSDVFKTMFHGSLPENNEIVIKDASPLGFRTFLRYFYFDDYPLDMDVIGEGMYLAKKYNIKEYYDICSNFLKEGTSGKHILMGYELAISLTDPELENFFEIKIVIENDLVFGSNEFHKIDRDLLKHILSIKYFKSCTKKRFDACMRWAEEVCKDENIEPTMKNRREQLGDCFELIVFGAMKRDELLNCVAEFGDLFSSDELQKIIFSVAAKSPVAFKLNDLIKCDINHKILNFLGEENVCLRELHFHSKIKTLLAGFSMLPLRSSVHNKSPHSVLQVTVLRSQIAASANKIHDNIIIYCAPYRLELLERSHHEMASLQFSEALILDTDSKYIIRLEVDSWNNISSPIRKDISADMQPFRILPESTCDIIISFQYKTLP